MASEDRKKDRCKTNTPVKMCRLRLSDIVWSHWHIQFQQKNCTTWICNELGQSGFSVLAKLAPCPEPALVAFLSRLRAYVHRQISPIHTITGLSVAVWVHLLEHLLFGHWQETKMGPRWSLNICRRWMMTQTIKQGWRGLNQTRKSHCILTYGHDDLDLSIFFCQNDAVHDTRTIRSLT